MCFTITRHTIRRIANKEIEVYKIVNSFSNDAVYSFFKEYLYIKNRLNPIENLCIHNNKYISIGYHSYTLNTCKIILREYEQQKIAISFIIRKFIIPKGTLYFINDYGEIVSETIILK